MPVPAPGEVLVQVKAVGICGSDVHGYAGQTGRRIPPLVMGHEAAGTVARVGSQVRGIREGTAVCFDSTIFCNACAACQRGRHNRCVQRSVLGVSADGMKRQGAMAEYVLLPAWTLHKIPPGLSFVAAALLEPVSIGMHAAARAGSLADRVVLIIGAGTIGLCTLLAVQMHRPRAIIVSDLNKNRLVLARSLGADAAVEPAQVVSTVDAHSDAAGTDVTFEVVGITETLGAAVASTRMGGRIVLIGNAARMPPVDTQAVISKELTLIGSYASAGEYPQALRAVASGAIEPLPLVSGVYPLEAGASCFRRLHRAEEDLIKIVLEP